MTLDGPPPGFEQTYAETSIILLKHYKRYKDLIYNSRFQLHQKAHEQTQLNVSFQGTYAAWQIDRVVEVARLPTENQIEQEYGIKRPHTQPQEPRLRPNSCEGADVLHAGVPC